MEHAYAQPPKIQTHGAQNGAEGGQSAESKQDGPIEIVQKGGVATVGVAVVDGVGVGICVGLEPARRQPSRALRTPPISSSTETLSSSFKSKLRQVSTDACSRAMAIPVTSSLMDVVPSSLQSAVQMTSPNATMGTVCRVTSKARTLRCLPVMCVPRSHLLGVKKEFTT
jgi:hypothetical protein